MAAMRREELRAPAREARIYRFPTGAVRRVVARERRLMYVRRRIAVASLALLVVLGGFLAALGGGDPVTSRPGAPRAVRLEPGATLWQVAERYAPPGSDPRAYVRATLDLNGLVAPPPAGARIKLPRSS